MEKNENEYFERDYTIKSEEADKEAEALFHTLADKGVLKAYHDVMIETPKYIDQKDKQAFEYLRERSDSFARSERCKVAAWVDYEKYEAWIYLTRPVFEFETPESREYIKEVAEKAKIVSFQIVNGAIEMHIYIPYFKDIADEETYGRAWDALFKKFEEEDFDMFCKFIGADDMDYPDDDMDEC